MLKNVVLPAPFGPMMAAMLRSSSVKSTALTASKPPKRLVTSRASRIWLDAAVGGRLFGLVQLGAALAAGEDPLGAKHHEQYERQTIDQELGAGQIHRLQHRDSGRITEIVQPARGLLRANEVEGAHNDASE